jgi:hypothetical protein
MSQVSQPLATPWPLGNRWNFVAPDSGPQKTPYACSFHWLRRPDESLIGLDVLRSDDLSRWGLRVFTISRLAEIKSLIVEMPSSEWAPFATSPLPR